MNTLAVIRSVGIVITEPIGGVRQEAQRQSYCSYEDAEWPVEAEKVQGRQKEKITKPRQMWQKQQRQGDASISVVIPLIVEPQNEEVISQLHSVTSTTDVATQVVAQNQNQKLVQETNGHVQVPQREDLGQLQELALNQNQNSGSQNITGKSAAKWNRTVVVNREGLGIKNVFTLLNSSQVPIQVKCQYKGPGLINNRG
ncbi:hypothetical protein K7X08_016888 [Anisodus acutangulus]|uniref:Uncharacterized protein n=1 Tax=Anisodus acutangulus TaxID=402998 RepID=A0A9Q1LTN4_9SOLA|nr:hypothetical protein K7X08_016888 [Anisodus acutangulus]